MLELYYVQVYRISVPQLSKSYIQLYINNLAGLFDIVSQSKAKWPQNAASCLS